MSTIAAKIAANQSYSKKLGWTPADFGGTANDNTLVQLIASYQGVQGLPVDGIAGPQTYTTQVSQQIVALKGAPITIVSAGKMAVLAGIRYWLKDVTDMPAGQPQHEPSRQVIDSMIRTSVGLSWTWEPPYDGSYQWCGAFAAACWREPGLPSTTRQKFWSSNYRLDRWARYQVIDNQVSNPRPPAPGPYRQILELDERSTPTSCVFADGTGPRAGDILLIGSVASGYGQHITVVESFDPSTATFMTVEGNGSGVGPRGNDRQGIVRARRLLGLHGLPPKQYHARRLIRVALSDLR